MSNIIAPVPPTPTVVVPTLSKTTFLKNPGDIIAYIIRHFCSTPKSLTETYWNINISMIDIISKYSGDSSQIASSTQQALAAVFNRIFGNGVPVVTVTAVPLIDPFDYAIEISVMVIINGTPYSITSTVTVDQNYRLVIS